MYADYFIIVIIIYYYKMGFEDLKLMDSPAILVSP